MFYTKVKILVRIACVLLSLCLAAPVIGQKSEFVGETVWACGDASGPSAKKKWTKVPGADHYQVKTDDGAWVNVEDDNYTYELEKGKLTNISVRPVINGNPGDETSVLVRQVGDPGQCPAAGPYGWNYTGGGSGGRGGRGGIAKGMVMVVVDGERVLMPAQSCQLLPATISVANYGDGTRCRHLGAGGLPIPSLIEQGIVDAVDIWGNVTTEMEVCFRNQGRLVLLDAATAPRRELPLRAYQRDGMICALVDRAGAVVMLRGQSQADQQNSAPQSSQALENCKVTTLSNLRLRSAPNGHTLLVLVPGNTYPTNELRAGYYRVFHRGEQEGAVIFEGWISADYVSKSGKCG